MAEQMILVVEDEPAIARLLKTCLESCGYAVQTAGGGEEGLRYAVEHHPDLVILDVRLPDLDGFEVCRQLRAINETVPVVMLTAMDRPLRRSSPRKSAPAVPRTGRHAGRRRGPPEFDAAPRIPCRDRVAPRRCRHD